MSLVKPCLAWPEAARTVARWVAERERVDILMDRLPAGLVGIERARCQHLVYGSIRHAGRLEAALGRLIAHPPRHETRGVLMVLGFELIDAGTGGDPGQAAKVVHHAVNWAKDLASPAEARLVNAVGRRLVETLGSQPPPPKLAPAPVLAEYFSHPEWLIRRWLAAFGAAQTRALLEWNQAPAPVHARWRGEGEPGAWAEPTAWPGFYRIRPGQWGAAEPDIEAGRAYVQDPSTRLAVEALDPKAGESWLDACAAPGGKSLMIADAAGSGVLVCADLGGPEPEEKKRFVRLAENIAHVRGVQAKVVAMDVLRDPAAVLGRSGLPAHFDGVLLDVPCSNTGVMRHRVDVKWRLQPGDFGRHARQQARLLKAAAELVAPQGRLVYSTCSIDAEENERLVEGFLAGQPGWKLETVVRAYPWADAHDGAGVFRLRRV